MSFGGAPNDDIVRTVRETRNIKLLPYPQKSEHAALVKSLENLVAMVTDRRTELARTGDW
jgi:hypothetical protein